MTRLALIGVGKIARDQHLPALRASDAFTLAATASPDGGIDGIPAFADLAALLASGIAIDAVAVCTPPGARHRIAADAIDAGLHVLLEKPPAATVDAVDDLVARAASAGTTLFAAWHSRFAPGVAPARAWLAGRSIRHVAITWREDIRRWHPGQEWILAADGFGVFDPGINALSILTAILPAPVALVDATIGIPDGRAAPLTADLSMRAGEVAIDAALDFLQTGPQTWTMVVETTDGTLALEAGGDVMRIEGADVGLSVEGEYPALYRHFGALIAAGRSDVDAAPLRLVANALRMATRTTLAPFRF